MKCKWSGLTHSMHFWTTWLPFWSLTHFNTFPSNSEMISFCWSRETLSRAFWITLQPYICRANGCTWDRSWKFVKFKLSMGYWINLDIILSDIWNYLLNQGCLLFRGAKLKKFLDDIVSKDVSHEIVGWGEDLVEDILLLIWNCTL